MFHDKVHIEEAELGVDNDVCCSSLALVFSFFPTDVLVRYDFFAHGVWPCDTRSINKRSPVRQSRSKTSFTNL